jgi:hypothetical protein
VLWADVVVTLVAGLALYGLAPRADTDFAWTITAPVTAALLGAGYWGSAVSIALALRASAWARVRILFVTGFVLTALALVPTVVQLDELHLDDGSRTAQAFACGSRSRLYPRPAVGAARGVRRPASAPAAPRNTGSSGRSRAGSAPRCWRLPWV